VSPRARVRLAVALVALAAAGAASAVAVVSRGEDGPEAEPPPLELGIALVTTATERELVAAERAYEEGDRDGALALFESIVARDPGSLEARIGAAVAAWPKGTTQKLRALVGEHPGSAVARLHFGLALFGDGNPAAAEREWREAEKREPDTPAALRAEDLLHPEMPPGRPLVVVDVKADQRLADLEPKAQLDELRRRAEEGGVPDLLLYGSVLQRLGRSVSAREAFDSALELNPDSVEARTAAAVARFDKNDPAQAFSRLGPLAGENPDAAVVRLHLGLLLLWLAQVDEAKEQLEAARQAEPDSVYGQEAARLLERLTEAQGG
jgi:tetratricopeptide (TPR) repeat protein